MDPKQISRGLGVALKAGVPELQLKTKLLAQRIKQSMSAYA